MYKQRQIFFIFSIIICNLIGCKSLVAQENSNVFDKIVIDAGHGGNKPGAIGSKYKEKDVTLAVAIKLGKLINENLKSVKVYYTRVIDQDIDLYKRSSIANKLNADLFLSIHCNSATTKAASGTETYAMGLGKTDRNLEVAKKENAEILTENNAIQNYEGFDMNSPETDILMSLYQNAYLNNSLDFAAKVQSQYQKNVPFKNRGVHQANFVVLWKAAMPAVLTEIGFISNPTEEEYIGSEYGQWVIASCIFRAICEYRNKVDNLNDPIPEINQLIPKDVQNKEQMKKELLAQQIEETSTQSAENKTEEDENKIKEQQIKEDSIQNIQKSGAEIIYRIQFMSSPTKLPQNDGRFSGLEDIFAYQDKEVWKYTAGMFATQKEALDYQKKVKEKYADAFVVAFHNGKRITIAEAGRLQKK
ncbi:MAG: N-acetylmuramoyl-L-alanine amidase [Bacteroidales bacterium]|nr:N-acetylmuramoyl-L-alanine amidase [Bacteroidales bacterium]